MIRAYAQRERESQLRRTRQPPDAIIHLSVHNDKYRNERTHARCAQFSSVEFSFCHLNDGSWEQRKRKYLCDFVFA